MAKVASEGFEAWRERSGGGRGGIPSLSLALRSSAVLYELNGKSFMVFWFSVLPPREARLAGRCLRPRLLVVAVTTDESVVTRRPLCVCVCVHRLLFLDGRGDTQCLCVLCRQACTDPQSPSHQARHPPFPFPSLTTPPSYSSPQHTSHSHHPQPPPPPDLHPLAAHHSHNHPRGRPPSLPRLPPATQTINF